MNKIIRICTVVMSVMMSIVFTAMTLPGIAVAQSTPNEIRLKADEQKKLNVFFSNFSEAFVEPFHQNTLTDHTLIRFGMAHNYANRAKLFEKIENGEKSRIRASYIDESAKKYFGRNIAKHQTSGEYQYRNGFYDIVNASGEMQQFSQATRVVDLGGNRYAVDINVYSASSGWVGSMHGTPQSWKKSGEEIPALSQKMKAIVAKTTGADGKPSYILLEYLKH